MSPQTCFLPQAPSNLVTTQMALHLYVLGVTREEEFTLFYWNIPVLHFMSLISRIPMCEIQPAFCQLPCIGCCVYDMLMLQDPLPT